MWCTRWFLPLLLLPLPTAPPFFLILFLFSLTLHAKPCFYCIVLLAALFVSSCYWQPFPIESPLAIPWADNVTTFADALNASLPSTFSQPVPSVIRAVDRCWCDVSLSRFFEPFNVSKWEHMSVERLKADMERQQREMEALMASNNTSSTTVAAVPKTTMSIENPVVTETPSRWERIRRLGRKTPRQPPVAVPAEQASETESVASTPDAAVGTPTPVATATAPPGGVAQENEERALGPHEYDLRRIGLGISIDFGWSR